MTVAQEKDVSLTEQIPQIILPPRLSGIVDKYFAEHNLPRDQRQPSDVVLALLRINTLQSISYAAMIVGKPITHCPPAIPPWPPKPVAVVKRTSICKVGRNTFLPTTGAFHRFRRVRVGMTKEQLKSRGVTQRDIGRWTKSKHIEWRVR